MKKILVAVAGILAVVGLNFGMLTPVWADDHCVDTSIINGDKYCDDGTGSGIASILNWLLTFLTGLVGVAAVIGMVISGIQYMASSGDEAKMVKAKNRIVQIVIGLVVWALMWAVLNWLIPGGATV